MPQQVATTDDLEMTKKAPAVKNRQRANSSMEGRKEKSQLSNRTSVSANPPKSESLPLFSPNTRKLVESEGSLSFSPANSFSYFRRNDYNPKLQRKLLYALNQRYLTVHKGNLQSNRILQDIQVKQEKSSKRIGLGGKLNALLRTKKTKQTRSGLFHLLTLSVMDLRSMDAAICLELLSDSALTKKRPIDSNKVFLTAMTNRMQGICLIMMEKGFPANINGPILGGNDPKISQKFTFPTYFQLAVVLGLNDVVKVMLKQKADPITSWYQITPIQNAVMSGNEELVHLLIEAGASANARLNLTDFFLLSKLKQQKVVGKFPLMDSPSPTQLKFPRQVGQRKAIDISVEYTNDINILLFELAYICGHTKLCQYLLEMTDPTLFLSSKLGLIVFNEPIYVKTLLLNGAPVNVVDHCGSTPLHLAARKGNLEVVILLLQSGMNVNIKGFNDWSPLHESAAAGHVDVSQYLIYKGADIAALNNSNRTPQEVATENGIDPSKLDAIFSHSKDEGYASPLERTLQNLDPIPLTLVTNSPKMKSDKRFNGLSIFSRDRGPSTSSKDSNLNKSRTSFFSSRTSKPNV